MAARIVAPPRTPSPKIRIHRSQSFDSPSSRMSVTPIDDSPYSKSTSAIVAKPLPHYDALGAAERGMLRRNKIMLHTRMSDDSMSDASSLSSTDSSPISPCSEAAEHYGLFSTGSPSLPSAPSPPPSHTSSIPPTPPYPTNTSPAFSTPSPPNVLSSNLSIYQDPTTPMYDPWLVRVVLDMFDVRGFDWMTIAEPIERIWGFRTSSAEVLGILSANGRIARSWWD